MKSFIVPLLITGAASLSAATEKYEAENSMVDPNQMLLVEDSTASGGKYVNMKDGALSFNISVGESGFYTLWTIYSQPNDTNGKIQNLTVNGSSKGQISFPYVKTFTRLKAASKVKLSAGVNTIGITKSWGWVNIDYAEVTPYESTPFSIAPLLVSPNSSENTKRMYGFLKDNFQKKIISGVMTNLVFKNDGNYTPCKVEEQTEVAWIIEKSGKAPALLGLDFMHSTGKNSTEQWHTGYTNATLSMSEDMYKKGGIPAYCWHWKDPTENDEAFYAPSAESNQKTTFNLFRAFKDSNTCAEFNVSSIEYQGIIKDLDIVAGYLKKLADKGIPVLWRPLHEAYGKWFWWGYKGPKACVALYKLMFDRFENFHKLNNLIWVWTTDEAANSLDWYPGDQYVDIIGRDYYYYPREANHGSLVSSFEKLKEMYNGKKIIALSENGSVPYPDSLASDGAGWSYFMPWYGDYAMDGWAHDNTADDWALIMKNSYVITLDKMPGWGNYIPLQTKVSSIPVKSSKKISYSKGFAEIVSPDDIINSCEIFTIQGKQLATLQGYQANGVYRIDITGVSKGTYLIRIKSGSAVINQTLSIIN